MNAKSKILLFMDGDVHPFGEFDAPVKFELDTRKLVDGDHMLTIVSKDPSGKEGIRKVAFVVRNGPSIAIEGLKKGEVVDGVLPLMISAYGKGDQKQFLIEGSETPRSIPAWIWAALVIFLGWATYYLTVNI